MTTTRTSPATLDRPQLNLRHPADVATAIPYLLGYHPTLSVVVLALRGKRLLFSIRDDLPATPANADIAAVVDHLTAAVASRGADAVVAVGYGPPALVRPTLLELGESSAEAGLAVMELLRVDGSRYWSYLCEDPRCCPPEGTPYDVSTSAVAASATVAGRAVMPDRRAYENLVRPITGGRRRSARRATRQATSRLFDLITSAEDEPAAQAALGAAGETAVLGALARQRRGGRLDDDEAAWLAVLLATVDVWHLAWARLAVPPPDLEVHRGLWLDVMRRADPDLRPAPGSLFAYAAWCCGEAILARLAALQVLAVEPGNWLANDILEALALGLRPPALPGDMASALRRRPALLPRTRSSSRRAGSRPR